MKKIHVIWQHFGPYHIARMNALGKIYPALTGLEIASNQRKYGWASNRENLHFTLKTLFDGDFEDLTQKDLFDLMVAAIEEDKPDVILQPGITESGFRKMADYAKRKDIKVVMMVDTWQKTGNRNFFLQQIKKILYNKYIDAIICAGIYTEEYYKSLNFPEYRLWRMIDVVDNRFYQEQSKRIQKETENNEEKSLLYVGRFSPEKNVMGLLRGFRSYQQQGGDWYLRLIGAGPQEREVKDFVREHNLRVSISPWMTSYELVEEYMRAGALVLPSISETWGLVVNEVMACERPVLISRNCGCRPELCWKGINGYDFDPYDCEEMSEVFSRFSSLSLERRREMGRQSGKIIAAFSPENWARSLIDCVETLFPENSA